MITWRRRSSCNGLLSGDPTCAPPKPPRGCLRGQPVKIEPLRTMDNGGNEQQSATSPVRSSCAFAAAKKYRKMKDYFRHAVQKRLYICSTPLNSIKQVDRKPSRSNSFKRFFSPSREEAELHDAALFRLLTIVDIPMLDELIAVPGQPTVSERYALITHRGSSPLIPTEFSPILDAIVSQLLGKNQMKTKLALQYLFLMIPQQLRDHLSNVLQLLEQTTGTDVFVSLRNPYYLGKKVRVP
ncbi:unnamed protein product [Angiostrongylus costaricensis]|uniref:Uncharacterized protein n=1 Tax=Angiostrongylus costaricensis TaxID=334426 RepID=A0A0R3Q178_ANGCS|nr:unnamed protein product [Angiostrongylus costaricensis]